MKTKNRNFLFSAVLMGIAMLLTACAVERDNAAATTPLGDKIVGKWYVETPKQVTLGTGENTVECAKVVLCGTFDADGEGFWSYILVDKQNRAIQPVGKDGKEHPYYANCNYSVTGNNVDVELTANYLPTSQMEWTFNYNGTCLQTKYEDRIIDLHPITTGEDAMFQEWMQQLGFGASADNYNINDKDITADNWRQTEAIYIYDGVGADVTDEKGRTGYTLVNLPWYNGDKLTNLPNGFCDDVTPEMGWEWVINRCGNRSIVGNNFFAVYNKYTGILRFFYYLPQGFSTGNDHVWQVSMTDNLATRTTIPYGVPEDRTFSNKAAINQTGQGTYMEYVTPWTDYLSQDGLIVPNAGWWAFDVDLSMTRPETLSADNSIKLQMRSWNTTHTSLYSTMLGNIDGTMQGSFEAQTTGNIGFAGMASSGKGLLGKLKDVVALKSPIQDVVTAWESGNYLQGLKQSVSLGKSAVNVASGLFSKKSSDDSGGGGGNVSLHTEGTYEGVINMLMKGNANTDGVISGSQPTVGIASPTFNLKDFDTQNSHLGQGVWNIKKTPVVYSTNTLNLVGYFRRKQIERTDEFKDWENLDTISAGNWTFFDPSSIEVELNPNVFPEDQIEWMQVDAIAGVRKEMGWTGTDPFRQAIGLPPFSNNTYKISNGEYTSLSTQNFGQGTNDYVFNFVGAGEYDGQTIDGTNYLVDFGIYKNSNQLLHLFGRGTDNYIIEPQATCLDDVSNSGQYKDGKIYAVDELRASVNMPFYYPAVEINVTVSVKLKSIESPIVLSRTYLPEFKHLEISHREKEDKVKGLVYEALDRILAKQNLSPKTKGHTQSYDFQAARINKCFKLLTGFSR